MTETNKLFDGGCQTKHIKPPLQYNVLQSKALKRDTVHPTPLSLTLGIAILVIYIYYVVFTGAKSLIGFIKLASKADI